MHAPSRPQFADDGMGGARDDRYRFIQVARAVAVLGVVLVHSQTVSDGIAAAPYRHGLWSFGQAGVDLFFVISGFIIAMVLDRPQSAAGFVGRRAARIVPFYWLFTLAALIVTALETAALPDPAAFVASMLLLPQDAMPVLGVGWSLEHEVIFYAIAATLLAVRRGGMLFPVMALLSIASVGVHLIAPQLVANGRDLHLLSLYHVQFLLGMALYRYRAPLARLRGRSVLLAGMLLFPVTGAVLQLLHQSIVPAQPAGAIGILRVGAWGLASACVLAGLLAGEARSPGAYRTRPLRALSAIGDASYTLYLSHPVALAFGGYALQSLWPAGWPAVVARAIAAVLAIGFAVLFYRVCERPLLARLSGFRAYRLNPMPVR